MSDAFAPPGESAFDLWMERSVLDGVILGGVAYGILFTITLQTLLLLLRHGNLKSSLPRIAYLFIVFILSTIGFGGTSKFIQMSYIDDRNIPGGPNEFTTQHYHHWINIMAFTSYTILSWFADALVLWRFILIWDYNYLVAILPSIIYLGSIGSSIELIVVMTRPNADFWIPVVVKLGISYWSLSISLNIIITLSIVGRLMYVRRRIRSILGDHYSNAYTSVAAMLIESAALYSIWGLAFLVCYARNTPFQNLLLPTLGQVVGMSPVLILLRVAQGRAWSRETMVIAQSQLRFSSRHGDMSSEVRSRRLGDVTTSDNDSNHVPIKANGHGEWQAKRGSVV